MKLYDAAIGSLARLAQHLSGMRSSTKLQESLIKASREGKITLDEKMEVGIGEEELATSAKLFVEFREMAGAQMNDLNVGYAEDPLTTGTVRRSSGSGQSVDQSQKT